MDARVKPAHDERRIVSVTAPALQRIASQGLRAALRPGNEKRERYSAALAGLAVAGTVARRKRSTMRVPA
jgi:hypothetical protein